MCKYFIFRYEMHDDVYFMHANDICSFVCSHGIVRIR